MNHRDLHRLERRHEPRLEPTAEKLLEAREQADAGLRLAYPQLFERQAPEPEPTLEVDALTADKVGADLGEAVQKVIHAGTHLGLGEYEDLHLRLNEIVNEINDFGAVLAERRSEQ